MKHAFRSLIALAAIGLSPASANPGGLDGATGHIFKFDLEEKSFELLKETEYDPKTETWGGYSVPMEDYKANLEKQISILKRTCKAG